jgi:hypothetical protein
LSFYYFLEPALHARLSMLRSSRSTTDTLLCSYPMPFYKHLQPLSGPQLGGTLLTVNGAHFDRDAKSCNFVSVASTEATFVSSTELQCRAPASAAGTVCLVITTAFGASCSPSACFRYVYVRTPRILTIRPASGRTLGGTPVTISTNAQFEHVQDAIFCRFNSALVRATVRSATEIVCISPPHKLASFRLSDAVHISVTANGVEFVHPLSTSQALF